MAAGEGFEPSHTESESAVLPLHNPAMRRILYPFFALCQEKYFSQAKKSSGGGDAPQLRDRKSVV